MINHKYNNSVSHCTKTSTETFPSMFKSKLTDMLVKIIIILHIYLNNIYFLLIIILYVGVSEGENDECGNANNYDQVINCLLNADNAILLYFWVYHKKGL